MPYVSAGVVRAGEVSPLVGACGRPREALRGVQVMGRNVGSEIGEQASGRALFAGGRR
ncbi:hypothetical protein AB5J49_27705 [Streptomyces sp. R28]|uniref:Uncharacterized protein n=1 Tax=Streptomyces sp. R28 TaxID=3238628 RepID=A0AB39Q2W5_9ACTN